MLYKVGVQQLSAHEVLKVHILPATCDEKVMSEKPKTASQAIHDAVTTHQVMASQHFMMTSALSDSNADLEDSTYDS
ncbi:hypothetical protein Tco_0062640, partial [Tanacetum coccineum]